MPLYEYRCTACGHVFEKIQSFSAADPKDCPRCGGAVERLLSAPAIHFKGSGFYLTDYGKAGAGKGAAQGEGKSEKSEGKSESKPGNSGASQPGAGKPSSGASESSGSSASASPSSGQASASAPSKSSSPSSSSGAGSSSKKDS